MAILPQQPERSHTKNISIVSTTEVVNKVEPTVTGRKHGRKFCTGKNSGVALEPQPSDSSEDPLWKKELAFASLLLGTAVVGIYKTMLVSVGGVLKTELNTSWVGVTALSGLPIMLGGFAGLNSVIVSQVIGKRLVYLVSSLLLLLSALWTMRVTGNYSEFLASRALSGLSWGMFESLVLLSVKEIYFAHERSLRITIYNVTNIVFTWGTPMLGGYVSQRSDGFKNQIMIVNIIQTISILLIVFATPETTFKRSAESRSLRAVQTTISSTSTSKSGFKEYFKSLRLVDPNATRKFQVSRAAIPLRALCAPTTVLTFLMAAPLVAITYATAFIISLLFSPSPIMALPTQLGLMFTGALVGSLIAYGIVALAVYASSRPLNHLSAKSQNHLTYAVAGILFGFTGILSFGLYVEGTLRPVTAELVVAFPLFAQSQDFNENIVSLLFGLLVSGAVVINVASINHIRSTTASPSESDAVEGAHNILQSILTGIFVIGMPLWIGSNGGNGGRMFPGLKDAIIALGVVQIVIGGSVAALLWVWGESISKLDGRVLGRRISNEDDELRHQQWKDTGSFFEG